MVCKCLDYFVFLSLACFVFLSLGQGKTLLVVCKCLDYDQSCIRYGHFTPRSQITLKIVWSRPWKLSPNKRQLHNINSNKYQSSGATTAPRPKLSDFATGNSLITSLYFEMANGKLFFHAKHSYLMKKIILSKQGSSFSFGKAELKNVIYLKFWQSSQIFFAKYDVCPLCVSLLRCWKHEFSTATIGHGGGKQFCMAHSRFRGCKSRDKIRPR